MSAARKLPSSRNSTTMTRSGALGEVLRHRLDRGVDQQRAVQNGLDLDAGRQRTCGSRSSWRRRLRRPCGCWRRSASARCRSTASSPFSLRRAGAQVTADANLGDVLDAHRHAVPGRDHDVANLVHALQAPGGADDVALAVILEVAGAAGWCCWPR